MITVGTAAADPAQADPGPGIAVQVDELSPTPPAADTGAQPVDDLDTIRQCNAILGALIGGVIGGSGSALPGALIGAGIGAIIGWTLLTPPGPPLGCWQPAPAPTT
ncbi:hypothetical protein [Nocardia tengchongensis]|uniref:hypothetical protein n=1 Tax=Nocardia tengchongensis TaxID=2055889 RepID=UPI0036AF3AF4